MFKIAAKKTFKATAFVHVPGEEKPAEIELTFKYFDKAQWESWIEKNMNKRTAKALDELIVDWDVVDENDKPVPYSLDNLIKLSGQLHTVESDITNAYVKELYGARQKN